jgi:DNA-binding FadR family transcriptional regulator
MGTPRIPKISKPPTLVEKVVSELAAQLRSGLLQKNQTLASERTLAAQLGVSRNVLREAIRCLQLQGLLEIRQGRGTRIVDQLHKPLASALSLQVPHHSSRLHQLFELREILEPKAAALAATRASKTQINQLTDAHHRLSIAQSHEESVLADIHFHRAIAEASGNQLLVLVLDSLTETLAAAHSKGFRKLPPSDPTPLQMHNQILKAISAQNPAAAESAMLAHLAYARNVLGIPSTPQKP